MNETVIAAMYKFIALPDFEAMREPVLQECHRLEVKGTLLLAHEGINGTVAGSRLAIDKLLGFLRGFEPLADLEYKESRDQGQPFYRMKVKLKKEIVTMGVEDINPAKDAGQYVEPSDWNDLIASPDVLLIDTRNQYEVDIGTFKGAISPNTSSFRELPEYVARNLDPARHKKVAMFCTGGIRCEKSTAYLKQQGFEEVYHLKGGILKYLEEVPEEQSLWQGECFVFDNRVAVNHRLEKGRYDLCHGCRYPLSPEDKGSEKFVEGVSCPHCFDHQTEEQRARFAERQKQIRLARQRNEVHIGAPPPDRQRRKSESAGS